MLKFCEETCHGLECPYPEQCPFLHEWQDNEEEVQGYKLACDIEDYKKEKELA